MLPDETDVLLVQDNPLEVELTLRPLRDLDPACRIGVARDGEEALDYLLGRGAYPPPARRRPAPSGPARPQAPPGGRRRGAAGAALQPPGRRRAGRRARPRRRARASWPSATRSGPTAASRSRWSSSASTRPSRWSGATGWGRTWRRRSRRAGQPGRRAGGHVTLSLAAAVLPFRIDVPLRQVRLTPTGPIAVPLPTPRCRHCSLSWSTVPLFLPLRRRGAGRSHRDPLPAPRAPQRAHADRPRGPQGPDRGGERVVPRRLEERAAGTHRVRPSVRAPDVQRQREPRQGVLRPAAAGRGDRHQRHHQRGPDQLLPERAHQRARPGALARVGPDGAPPRRHRPGEARRAARRGAEREAPGGERALRPGLGLPHAPGLPGEPSLLLDRDRLDGGPRAPRSWRT